MKGKTKDRKKTGKKTLSIKKRETDKRKGINRKLGGKTRFRQKDKYKKIQ